MSNLVCVCQRGEEIIACVSGEIIGLSNNLRNEIDIREDCATIAHDERKKIWKKIEKHVYSGWECLENIKKSG